MKGNRCQASADALPDGHAGLSDEGFPAAQGCHSADAEVVPNNPLGLQLAGLIEYELKAYPQAESLPAQGAAEHAATGYRAARPDCQLSA
jgi:hypothetical protein